MNGPAEAAADWPDLLRPLVATYGIERITRAVDAALGYPPQWIRDLSEVRAVLSQLDLKGSSG